MARRRDGLLAPMPGVGPKGMTPPGAPSTHRPRQTGAATFDLSEQEFTAIAARIHRDTGIVIGTAKRSMLISRLAHRLRRLGLTDFGAYLRLLNGPDGEAERRALVSAITTNVTQFFREPHHFDALADLAPTLIQRAKAGGRVRLWSAGCSTGQEAYCMAATLLEKAPDIDRHDLRILATDIDADVIERAKAGVYDRHLLGEDPPPALRRNLEDGPSLGQVSMAGKLRSLLRFEVLNLLEPWPFQGRFDVIFCRNVVIYFDAQTRHDLWRRFAARTVADGMLFIGHSERMDPQLEPFFSPCGITQYRRTALPLPDTLTPSLPLAANTRMATCHSEIRSR